MGNVAKLFPYRDSSTGRLAFRGMIGCKKGDGTEGVSRFVPVRIGDRLMLRGKRDDGMIAYGFPYREPATGRLMGRTAVGASCPCPVPTDLKVDIYGITSGMLVQPIEDVWYLGDYYGWYGEPLCSAPVLLYIRFNSGLDTCTEVDLSNVNGSYICNPACLPSTYCAGLYYSDWKLIGASTISGVAYVSGEPVPWSDSIYLWAQVIVECGQLDPGRLAGTAYLKYGFSCHPDVPPDWSENYNQYNALAWTALGTYHGCWGEIGSFESDDECELNHKSLDTNTTVRIGSIRYVSAAGAWASLNFPYSDYSASITAGYGGTPATESCPAILRICARSCCYASGHAWIRIADQEDNTIVDYTAVVGCKDFELERGGSYKVTCVPEENTGGDVVNNWAMVSGEPHEHQEVVVADGEHKGVIFYVRPLFAKPKIKVSGIAGPLCNGGYPHSTGVGACVAGGGIYQIPANLLNGVWQLDTLARYCGYSLDTEFEGTYWENSCNPVTGTIHVKARLYYGDTDINGVRLTAMVNYGCRWLLYLEVYVDEELTCTPRAWAYFAGPTSIYYPYYSDLDVEYELIHQGPGLFQPFTGQTVMVGVQP